MLSTKLAQVAFAALYEHFNGDMEAAWDYDAAPLPACRGGGKHAFPPPEDARSTCQACQYTISMSPG